MDMNAMHPPPPGRQHGFTLLEIIIALVIVGGLYMVAANSFGPALKFKAEIETIEKQKDLRQAMLAAYKLQALSVDAEPGAKMDFASMGIIDAVTPDPSTGRCPSNANTFAPISSFLATSAGVAYRDGYGNPLCVFISPQKSMLVSGSTIFYHSVAIISPGKNGVMSPLSGLTSEGALSAADDDVGTLLDGRFAAQERYDMTRATLRRVADVYQAYFSVRYQSDPARSISVDYFSCGDATACPPSPALPRWDSGNGMPSTCAAGVPMFSATGISPNAVLGLSQTDVTDGYGNIVMMDNCGASVRSPGNATASMQTPPYTAAIYTTLPGGSVLSQSAIGQF